MKKEKVKKEKAIKEKAIKEKPVKMKKTGQAKAMSPGAVPDAYKQKTYAKMILSRKASWSNYL